MNQPMPGYTPPQRQGKPWWIWLLFGCAGCAVLVVIAGVVLGGLAVSTVRTVMEDVGPVSSVSVRQALGEDFPIYPEAELQEAETQGILVSFRFLEKLTGKPKGSIFGGAAMYDSADSPEKVLKYYEAEMEQGGWKKVNTQESGLETQVQYRKGNEFALIQVQKNPSGSGTQITLMRGGSELADLNRQRQESETQPKPAP